MDIHFPIAFLCFAVGLKTCDSCSHDIPHGHVTWWCSPGDGVCPYSCDEGYEENPDISWITCTSSGQWVSLFSLSGTSKDLCMPKPCPNQIPNGRLSDTCESKVGSVCEYSCDMGYQKKADVASITCQTSTNWSVNPHSLCTNNKQCGYKVANGDLDLSCRRHSGDTCSFSCREGYLPSAVPISGTIVCGSALIWSQPLSSLCEEIQCPSTIPNGVVSSHCSRAYKAYCDYDCNEDYVKTSAALSLKCNASGEWQWREHGGEPCAKKDELCPSKIKNGEIVWHCHRQPGARCTYDCDSGCSQDRSRVWLSCGNDGQWNTNTDTLCTNCSTTTTARPSQCPYIIPNGRMFLSCSRSPNSVCQYTCSRGCSEAYNTLRCSSFGYWHNEGSACLCQESTSTTARPNQCPVIIPNGSMNLGCSRSPYTVCSYTCTRGCSKAYSTLRCSGSGHWHNEGSACRCQGLSVTSSTTTTTTFPRRCPSTIPNGFISVVCERSPYRRCDYACDGGCYKVYGNLYCSSERQWEYGDSACRCRDFTHSPLPEPESSSSPSRAAAIVGTTFGVVGALTAVFIFVALMYRRYKGQQIRNQLVRYQAPATQRNQTAFSPGSTQNPAPAYTLPGQDNIYTSLQQNNNIEPYSQLQSIINGPPDYDSIPKPGEDPPSYEQVISNPSEFKV